MPKYNHIDNIPAKVFFRILETKDLQQLKPKSREKGLNEVFIGIYDDFFIKSDNPEAKEYFRLYNEIIFLEHKIKVLQNTCALYVKNSTTKQMKLDFYKALKEGYGIELDEKEDFLTNIHRVVTKEIGFIENDLAFAKADFKQMAGNSQKKTFDYFESIGALGNILTGNSLVKEGMSLSTYVALSNMAKKQIQKQEQEINNNKNKHNG